MSAVIHTHPQVGTQSRSLTWKCGDIDMGRGLSDSIREGNLADWSRNGLDVSVAYDQVHIIISTTINAIEAIRGMVAYSREIAMDLLNTRSIQKQKTLSAQIDALLEQIAGIVSDASLGNINLLGKGSGCLSIPYLLTEVRDIESFHSFVTMGISISPIHEEIPGQGEMLVGIYNLTTEETDPVCWLGAPGFWLQLNASAAQTDLDGNEFLTEISIFLQRIAKFDRSLNTLSEQLEQYIKMVGEVVTDPVFEA